MSASNFTPIQLYRTATAAATPSAGNLADGELAINLTDEKLYFKNASGVVKLLASNSGSLGSVTSVNASGGTTGLTFTGGPITSSGTLTLGGTLGVANGGTGTSTQFTAGSVVFAGASGVYTQDNTQLFWDNTNDRLGIGTATPSQKLEVNGAMRVGGASGVGYINFSSTVAYDTSAIGCAVTTGFGDSLGLAVQNATGVMTFATNSSERMRIDASGNVGIGTTPSYKLDVSATGSISGQFKTSGSINALYLADAGTTAGTLYVGTVGNDFRVVTGSNEQMRITSAGNVGIGTTSPNGRLEVSGRLQVGTLGSSNNTFGLALAPVTAGQTVFNIASISNKMVFSGGGNSDQTTNTEWMCITNTGNVGIGTSLPNGKLTVAGAITSFQTGITDQFIVTPQTAGSGVLMLAVNEANNAYRQMTIDGSPVVINTAGSERMRIDSSGNVGIGTSAPNALLTVSNGGAAGYEVNPTGGVGGGATVVTYNRSTLAYTSLTTYASAMTWHANGSTRAMDLDTSGRLMVGTTSPINNNMVTAYGSSQNCFVAQVTNNIYSNFQGFNSSGTATFQTDGSGNGYFAGNVGIGTSSPAVKLHVEGSGPEIRVQSTNSSDGFIRFVNTSGSYSIGMSGAPVNALLTYDRGLGQTVHNYLGGASGYHGWYTNDIERMRIDSSGNLLVGTTSANGTLSVVGDQISVGSAGGSSSLGIQIKGTALSAIPAAQVQGYIATGNSSMGVAGDLLIAPRTDVAANIRFITGTSPAERMRITDAGNLQLGTASLATNATNGFPYIPTCAGTPTGTPTAITGYAPMVVDSTNNKLYVYVGGAWQAMN